MFIFHEIPIIFLIFNYVVVFDDILWLLADKLWYFIFNDFRNKIHCDGGRILLLVPCPLYRFVMSYFVNVDVNQITWYLKMCLPLVFDCWFKCTIWLIKKRPLIRLWLVLMLKLCFVLSCFVSLKRKNTISAQFYICNWVYYNP